MDFGFFATLVEADCDLACTAIGADTIAQETVLVHLTD